MYKSETGSVPPGFALSTGSGMSRPVGFDKSINRQVGILLCCCQTLMAQQLLDRPKICSIVEQVSGEGVAKKMRMDIQKEGTLRQISVQDPLYRSYG